MKFRKLVDKIKAEFESVQYLREKIICPDQDLRIIETVKSDK